MYHEDWLIRQIRFAVEAIARMLFNKQKPKYEILDESTHTATDVLHNRLLALLEAGQVNEAENLLFEHIRSDDLNTLLVALDFYARLNDWDEKTLEKHDFSREEILRGLEEIKDMFGITL